VIVIDKSDYWPTQFSQLQRGVYTLLTRLMIGADQTHVAMASYSSNATLHYNLVQYFSAPPMEREVIAIRQDDTGTVTSLVGLSNN